MFEHKTQEQIYNDALNNIRADVDKREGSIVDIAISPFSIEAKQLYIAMDGIIQEMFGDTASREFLIKLARDRGIVPEPASHAVLKGEFNIDIPIGSRFSLDDLNYTAIKKISNGVYQMQCETAGEIGNFGFGTLIPIEYIDGLTKSELTELLIPGEDEEDTEVLRSRYLDSFDSQAFGGNRKDYMEKVHTIPGVGGVKVYRAWKGGSTVKLVIMNSQFNVPTQTLLDEIQEAIDPIGQQGEGVGIAPIGHVVSIFPVDVVKVDIGLNITYDNGSSWADVELQIQDIIDDYLLSLKKEWEKSSRLIVRISQIEARLLEVEGILDLHDTVINGKQENLILDENSIPERGNVYDLAA